MPKPLRSESQQQPQNNQFKDFGVLNTGGQGKGSLFTSIVVNVLLLLIAVIIGAAAKKTIDNRKKEIAYVVPLKEKPPEPIKPKIIPPKIVPPKPVIKPPEPKIVLPEVKPIEPPKPVAVTMPKPLPAVTPAPPKAVVAAAAPKPVSVHLGQSASVVNNDAHPSAVALGRADNPIHPSNMPATANVNLGQRGLSGMPSTNTGGGPASARVNLGSGQPNGSLGGSGARAVQGVSLGGVTGGTGTRPGNGIGSRPAQVALGQAPPPPPTAVNMASKAPVKSTPTVVYKPRPVYTSEATEKHIEGNVSVRIHVTASGQVSSADVTRGLGYGLDQAALTCARAIRFRPAVDANGTPIDWEGVVNISFQLAS